ncbi:LTA synthase family protein [Fibrobacter sp. UWH1]|uniref:LTA synthase family protein n=1 Tax=Fibrobacter sp. UWH1 TaxID=1964354 RepID=UPI000B51F993|nr:alkaline phosphatase family protein [Fibrobacter sp. UWH1]OWV16221.1 hypothetical protein B7992_03225 [Fibrobacter sp. UWH1]
MAIIISLLNKIKSHIQSHRNLVFLSLAFWVAHIILRVLLLFRSNPYGFPFVSKPDWYIFHAVCLDFIWISKALVIFLVIAGILKAIKPQKNFSNVLLVIYAVFQYLLFDLTLFDNEVQRFLGCHLTFGIANTYKDTSSLVMLWDYVANDYSIPFLQFILPFAIIPFIFVIYKILGRKAEQKVKSISIGMVIFFIMSSLFINVIWTGNARMTKLRPVVTLIYNEIVSDHHQGLTYNDIKAYSRFYQNLWTQVEGDSLWNFTNDEKGNPLYRTPSNELLQSEKLQSQRAQKPNFILVFMESHRGWNTGFLNQGKTSPTPYYDSLAQHSRIWERMHTSGLPTTGGVLTTHIGIPHHSTLAQATDLAHITLPSFASTLTDSGYATHYFSAADPAWDNLGVWMSKWYTAQHYDRNREDDSTFFDHATEYVLDTLSKQGKPFLATLMTRSNHYPFNFAAGMTDEQKQQPLTERINVTMNYADRQLSHFMRAVEKQPWFENTYVIIMADHGFPLGENGVSTMNGGAYSNATWIPFLIYGKGIEPARDTATTAQMDIAPTILELAGIATPNIFMGHNLLRGYGDGLSLGAYAGVAAVGYENRRLIEKLPLGTGDVQGLFAEGDTHQEKNLADSEAQTTSKLKAMLDSLITISDYSLEHGI